MRCDTARELIGLGPEIASSDRTDLARHVADCAACAAIAADDAAMGSLLATRTVPAFADAQRSLLLHVPPPGLATAIWRARLATWAPVATLAIVLLLGARALDGRADSPPTHPSGDGPPVAPTLVARIVRPREGSPVVNKVPQPARPPVAQSAPPADLVFVVEPAPVVAVGSAAAVNGDLSRTPVDDERSRGSSGGGGAPVGVPPGPQPTVGAPSPTAVPTQGVQFDLTVQAVTDLAGGSTSCPGCDGITPADGAAATTRPVGRVWVRLWALDENGGRIDLGQLALGPVNAGVALATASVPEASGYAIRFEAAEGGFTLCPASEPEVVVRPGEGGLFAAFRLWGGCPAPPPLSASSP